LHMFRKESKLLPILFGYNRIPVRILDADRELIYSSQDFPCSGKTLPAPPASIPGPCIYMRHSMEMYAFFPFRRNRQTYHILAGPAFTHKPASRETLQMLSFYTDEAREEMERLLYLCSTTTLSQFSAFVRLLYTLFTNRVLQPEKLLCLTFSDDLQQMAPMITANTRQGQPCHLSCALETALLNIVKSGDLELAPRILSSTLPEILPYDRFTQEYLRQVMYTFVRGLTLVTRFAVEGGLDENLAFTMYNIYLQQADGQASPAEIWMVFDEAVLDFTQRVRDGKQQRRASRPVLLAQEYIDRHLYAPIRLSHIAEASHLTGAYLSVLFKKETGISITEYIRRQRIEQAKKLLTDSNRSILNISNHLCFSSQSYFIKTFRECVGTTPRQYRLEHSHRE